MSDEVEKAESTGKALTRPLTERGQPQILSSTRFIQDQRRTNLRMPVRLATFDKMAEDDAVANSIDVTNILVTTAMQNGEFVSPSGSGASKLAAEFLNYNIRNMTIGTWLESVNNAATDLQYGFSLQNIVVEKRTTGQFAGSRVLKKLAPRDQKGLFAWVWDKELRNVKGFIQKPNRVQLREPTRKESERGVLFSSLTSGGLGKHPFIATHQMLHFRHNPTNNSPQGDSPLMHIHDAWLEKKLVEKYEVVGVSKDMGGTVLLRVPSSLVEKANDPLNNPIEAAEYAQLQKDAGALHAGDSTFLILISDTDDKGNRDFDFELKGIDGGGKQYNTSEIIDQKRKSIYNMFGTGFLLLGQSGGGGSFALAGSQMSMFDHYVNRSILWKTDVINTQLAPRLLAINNIELSWRDMPVFQAADPTKPDIDMIGKTIMRMKSVMAMTPEALETFYKMIGLPTEGIEDLSFEDKGDSRAGESQGSSGTGNSQSNGESSSTNGENGGVAKNLILDNGHLVDIETGDLVDLKPETETTKI